MSRAIVTAILNLAVTKPIAIFVWWLSSAANRIRIQERIELNRRVARARGSGRPVLFASNHVSMFDDPIVPMALFRTGPRSTAELAILAALLGLYWAAPFTPLPPALPGLATCFWAAGISCLGARKTWWSLGDLVNFSGAVALRAKLEAERGPALPPLHRVLLAAADPIIFFFMRSGAVKTVFVDRRAGAEAKQARAQVVARTVECATRLEPVWIFFEGGRAKTVGEIGPARRGIGDVVLGLWQRGLDPLVVAVHHGGLEKVIPRGTGRWLTGGHCIEVSWSECALERESAATRGEHSAQAIADAVRTAVVQLQRSGSGAGEDHG